MTRPPATCARRRVLQAAALALGLGALPRTVRADRDAAALARPAAPAASGPAARWPAPGSYTLPRLQAAPDGRVRLPDGRAARLHALLRGRSSVLSFMYTYCRDPVGCPLAWRAMDSLRDALLQSPALAQGSQLVSLSFDPTHDTPHAMRLYSAGRGGDARVRWHFLTTDSVGALLPLLRGFGQEVSVETDAAGRPARTLNHLLKVFLVDDRIDVREIYSVATLDPAAIVGDLRTLQLERAAAGGR